MSSKPNNSSSSFANHQLSQNQKLAITFALLIAFSAGLLAGSLISSPLQCSNTNNNNNNNNNNDHGKNPLNSFLQEGHKNRAASEDNKNSQNKLEMPNDDIPTEKRAAVKSSSSDEMKKLAGVKNGEIDKRNTKDENMNVLPVMESLEYRKPALCPAHRRIQSVLTRYIDIDFIEFVTSSCPDPSKAMVLDIGLFHGGEVSKMAKQGFNVIGFEPNPVRFGFCKKEIDELKPAIRNRVELHNAAVSDQSDPLYFQLAGVDSHAYFVENGGPTKIKTIVVPSTPVSTVFKKHRNFYFVKVDTQGFDTRIVESMVTAMEQYNATAEFIQFEFSPYFEVTRSKRSKEEHKRFFRVLQDAGYDIFMGAAVQPWLKSMRSTYGKTPLSMICPEHKGIPTCIDDFVEYMHASKERAIRPGKTSTDFGSWMDLLAVRRSDTSPFWRHTGWVLARKM